MMSDQSNTTVIQNLYSAFNRGNVQAIVSNTSQNAEWLNDGPVGAVPYFGDFTGRISDFFSAIGESTTGGKVEIDRYIGLGDVVITEGRFTATVRSSGARINARIAHVFTLQNGIVTSWRGYGDTASVLAAHTGKAASA